VRTRSSSSIASTTTPEDIPPQGADRSPGRE
jgi:hypothetical protein